MNQRVWSEDEFSVIPFSVNMDSMVKDLELRFIKCSGIDQFLCSDNQSLEDLFHIRRCKHDVSHGSVYLSGSLAKTAPAPISLVANTSYQSKIFLG